LNKGPEDPAQQQDEQGLEQELTSCFLAFCFMVQASLPNSASYQASGKKLQAGHSFARFSSLGHPFSQND
jgi:hypothetical protein